LALFNVEEMSSTRITRIVLHEIGPSSTDFRLLNGTLPPGELEGFFLDRLKTANNGSSYAFKADSGLRSQLLEVQNDPGILEDVGKRIATSFNQRHQGNVNAGMLAIFELESAARALYAIVKFDSQRVVAIAEEADDHARLELLRKTIVESKDAMQKSAIIRLTDDGGALAVRDRRTNIRIPAYFVDFLGAERILSEKDLTKRLSDAIKETAEEQREILGDRLVREMPTRIYQAVQNLDDFDPESDTMFVAVFGAVPEDSPVRVAFASKLEEKKLEHEQFTLAKGAIQRPTRLRITTAEDVQIVYGLQYEGNAVRVHTDENTEITTITVTTQGKPRREQLP
jgi:hypothetical protein